MSSGKGGGFLHSLIVHPIKSLLGFIFVIALALTLILPPQDAINTIGAVSVTLYRTGGVVVGSIPPGIEGFKEGFSAMSNYQPKPSGWSQAGGNSPAAPTTPKAKPQVAKP
jgi:hypothetical protein